MRESIHAAWSEEGASPTLYSLPGERSPGGHRSDDLRELRRQEREEAKNRTRQALMAAGLDGIIETGLDVSVAEICRRAGYSRGAFHVHFRDRQEFMAAIAEWMFAAMSESFIADESSPDSVAVSAQRFTHALSTGQWPLMPRIRVAAVRLLDALIRWPEVRQVFGRFTTESMERFQKGVTAGQQAGLVRADLDPRTVGSMLVVASMGAIILHDVGLSIDYKGQAEALLRLITPTSPAATDVKRKSRAS